MDITNTTDCLKINFQLHHVYFSLGFSFTQCIWMILNFIICKECDDALLNGRMNLPHCKYFWEQKWFLDAVFHQKFMILEASCNFDWQKSLHDILLLKTGIFSKTRSVNISWRAQVFWTAKGTEGLQHHDFWWKTAP